MVPATIGFHCPTHAAMNIQQSQVEIEGQCQTAGSCLFNEANSAVPHHPSHLPHPAVKLSDHISSLTVTLFPLQSQSSKGRLHTLYSLIDLSLPHKILVECFPLAPAY